MIMKTLTFLLFFILISPQAVARCSSPEDCMTGRSDTYDRSRSGWYRDKTDRDDRGTYRGKLNNNRYDPDSVSNPYGRYGSKYSTDSINNPYGAGSKYRTEDLHIYSR